MSQIFGALPDSMIPHWTSGATQSVLGASYHSAAHLRIKPRITQTTLDTLGVQPPITGAIHAAPYRALVSLANRQAMNAALSGEGNPWLNAPCNTCSSTVANYHSL